MRSILGIGQYLHLVTRWDYLSGFDWIGGSYRAQARVVLEGMCVYWASRTAIYRGNRPRRGL